MGSVSSIYPLLSLTLSTGVSKGNNAATLKAIQMRRIDPLLDHVVPPCTQKYRPKCEDRARRLAIHRTREYAARYREEKKKKIPRSKNLRGIRSETKHKPAFQRRSFAIRFPPTRPAGPDSLSNKQHKHIVNPKPCKQEMAIRFDVCRGSVEVGAPLFIRRRGKITEKYPGPGTEPGTSVYRPKR